MLYFKKKLKFHLYNKCGFPGIIPVHMGARVIEFKNRTTR